MVDIKGYCRETDQFIYNVHQELINEIVFSLENKLNKEIML